MAGIREIKQVMRADAIPAGGEVLWAVRKRSQSELVIPYCQEHGVGLYDEEYTFLHRYTEETINKGGEVVMEDTPAELSRHLNFVLKAQGRVLVSGLGLGCVVRGLLCKEDVEKVVVVERDQAVLDLVASHMPQDGRLEIIQDCAIKYSTYRERYDFAWHDIWSDPDAGEPHLSRSHLEIMKNSLRWTPKQGAWGFDRWLLAALSRKSWWYGRVS